MSAQCWLSKVGDVSGGGRSVGISADKRSDKSMLLQEVTRSIVGTGARGEGINDEPCDGVATASLMTDWLQCSHAPLQGLDSGRGKASCWWEQW